MFCKWFVEKATGSQMVAIDLATDLVTNVRVRKSGERYVFESSGEHHVGRVRKALLLEQNRASGAHE